MDFIQTLITRRSIRNFKNQSVPRELIKKIIDLAIHAPSACNRQEWRFIVIEEDIIKKNIFDLGGSQVITQAPVVILVLYSNQTTNLEYHDDIQSASAAIENLLLAASDSGLGGCWVCHLPTKSQLRKLLAIPSDFDPVAAVVLGYPNFLPKPVNRKYQAEQVISYNQYNFSQAANVSKDSNLRLRRLLIKIYQSSPLFIKRKFLNRFLDKNLVKKFDN